MLKNYIDRLPVELELEKINYNELESWEFCLVHVTVEDINYSLVIEKYQQHYGTVKWESLFSNVPYGETRAMIVDELYKKYPKILINEDCFIKEFKAYRELNPNDYHYYNNHYTQEVEQIKGDYEWLEMRKFLNIN